MTRRAHSASLQITIIDAEPTDSVASIAGVDITGIVRTREEGDDTLLGDSRSGSGGSYHGGSGNPAGAASSTVTQHLDDHPTRHGLDLSAGPSRVAVTL